jgi:methylmalonyl-CoA mutase
MTDLSAEYKALAEYRPTHKVRFVTAASLFDGHDAAINIMRRILMGMGAEVIHLGHNRSVDEVVTAALQEDAHGIAISSYQGGHVEYFKYMVDMLKTRGGEHVQVFGGGGGVIVRGEIAELQEYGVSRIYSPEDGQRMGLAGMIGEMVMRCDHDLSAYAPKSLAAIEGRTEASWRALAQLITALENGHVADRLKAELHERAKAAKTPVLGITGTGGAGKSSLTDELIRRLRLDQGDRLRIAVISIDPSRRKTGGALLGDRIRMNAIGPWATASEGGDAGPRVYMRSLATRDTGSEISQALPDVLAAAKCAGFDLVIVETSGIGQGDAAIVPLVDVPMYVMTPEFGAASQLEKIDMLDFAEFVAINKFDRKGAADALRDVAKQVQRNRQSFGKRPRRDAGVRHDGEPFQRRRRDRAVPGATAAPRRARPCGRVRQAACRSDAAQHAPGADRAGRPVRATSPTSPTRCAHTRRGPARRPASRARSSSCRKLRACSRSTSPSERRPPRPALDLAGKRKARMGKDARHLLQQWPDMVRAYAGDEYVVKIRDKEIRTALTHTTLSGSKIRKVALPSYEDHGEILKWLMLDNVPGSFPYTAGTFAFKREGEDPTRMFAGEGDAFKTNARFKLLSAGMPAEAPVDRVRLGHLVRQRSGDPARHLRQGRQLGRLDRDARRHEGAVFGLRPVQPRRPRSR